MTRHIAALFMLSLAVAAMVFPVSAGAQIYFEQNNQDLYKAREGAAQMKKPLFDPQLPIRYRNPVSGRDYTTTVRPPVKPGESGGSSEYNPYAAQEGKQNPSTREQVKQINEQNKKYAEESQKEQTAAENEEKAKYALAQKEERKAGLERALFNAIYNGDKTGVQKVMSTGVVDPNTLYQGYTPLHYAAALHKLDIILLLLDNPKVSIGNEEDQYFTLLHWAAYENHSDLVQKMLERGANANVRDEKQRTPYQYAVSQGHRELADLLMKHTSEAGRRGYNIKKPKH